MNLKKSFILPFLLSFSLYSEYFNISNNLLNTLIAFYAFYLLFTLNKKELFIAGFITSICWFYWIGYSFIYYDLVYLVPFILIGIGLLYAILFYFIGYFHSYLYRFFTIVLFSYIEPFGFNWFKLELLFINSYIGITKIEFILFLLSVIFFISFLEKKKFWYLLFSSFLILGLILFNNLNYRSIPKLELKIDMISTNLDQEKKWLKQYRKNIINQNIKYIQNAIEKKYDIVILPETAFPISLNLYKDIYNRLKVLSKNITIITGGLEYKDNGYYNSTYLFYKNSVQTAQKVVLVPFGEKIPFPQFITNWINKTFYNNASDYKVAYHPTTFTINNIKFRNAICYEATTDKIYKNLDTSYVIAISNNGWFTPSIEPTLQKLLLKYYAKKYNLVIYSVTNQSQSFIITH